MKLEKLILKNFRSYTDEVVIDFNDLTAFIGKNDAGKSTILEALEIFFNNSTVKIEQDDASVYSANKQVLIGCIFSDIPEKIILDTSAVTNLKNEYLLNHNDFLEIHKVYDCSKKTINPDVYLVASYPTVEQASDLHSLTSAQLKKRIKELEIDETEIDLRSNVSMRRAIYKSIGELNLAVTPVSAAKGDVKSMWDKLKFELPIFTLFQSDRPSLDGDSEVQDPMKVAVKQALEKVQTELESIKNIVKEHALEVARHTVEKIKEMDENLAKQLQPDFIEEPKWSNIFKLTLDGDENIPINKRGSGVRRLILLNFFRAEAERKKTEGSNRGVIYAIEEPETAQHPSNQILLADALKKLSDSEETQVILTTHVPGFAGMLPIDSLRYISNESGQKNVLNACDDEEILSTIADALGVLPDAIDDKVKVAVFVEGPHDIVALKAFSEIISKCNPNTFDLNDSENVIILPSGGSTLKGWVENYYLKALGIPEVHIYDRDEKNPPKYQKWCDMINRRTDGSIAFLTNKREMENYIHPQIIKDLYAVELVIELQTNVPKEIAAVVEENEKTVKTKLNSEGISLMTYEQICEIDTEREIETWLEKIASFCLKPTLQ